MRTPHWSCGCIEAVGLWRQRRWAEYLTLVVTASLLPLEIYELAHRLSRLEVITFASPSSSTCSFAKRLFGLRGGEEALRRERAPHVGSGRARSPGPRDSPGRRPASERLLVSQRGRTGMVLEDKVAIIYGGGGSIGSAVARQFAREGASVRLAARRRRSRTSATSRRSSPPIGREA